MLACVLQHWPAAIAEAAPKESPSFFHGVGQVIWGLTIELPKTVVDATLSGPPVVGTAVGLLAGVAQASRKTAEGLGEMAAGFNPFGTKRRNR